MRSGQNHGLAFAWPGLNLPNPNIRIRVAPRLWESMVTIKEELLGRRRPPGGERIDFLKLLQGSGNVALSPNPNPDESVRQH